MANFFDQFDAPAAAQPQAAPAANFFDQFDGPAQPATVAPLTIQGSPQSAGDALNMVEGTGSAAYDTGPAESGATYGDRLRNLGGMAVAGLDGIANSVPFTDRLAALAAAGTGIGGKFGDYSGNLAQLRGEEGAAMDAHPGAALAGSIAGGAAVPLPALGAVASGASLGGKVIRGIAAGGLIGGAQGASSSSDLTDARQTAKDTAEGAGFGALAGGAIPVTGAGYGALQRLLNRDAVPVMSGVTPAARDVLLSAIAKDGPETVQRNAALYGDPAMLFDYGAGLKGVAQGLATKDGQAAAVVGDALGARQAATNARVRTGLDQNFGPAQDPAAVASSIADTRDAATVPLFARAAQAGVPYPTDLAQRPAVASALRDAATDAANRGTPFPTITLDEAGQPVASQAALDAYNAGTRPAVTDALAGALGADPTRGPLTIEAALKAQRSAAADPLYAKWRDTPVPMTPDLQDILSRPSVARALPDAERKAADQGRSIYARSSDPASSWERDPLGSGTVPDSPGDAAPGMPATPDNTYFSNFQKPTPPDVPRPQTARDVIRGLGGVRDSGGDLAARGVDEMGPGIGTLLHPPGSGKGVSADEASQVLAQLGYFGADTEAAMRGRNTSLLADALTNHPSYPEGAASEAWAAHDSDMRDWQQWKSDTAGNTRYRDPAMPGRGPAPSYAPEDMGLPPGGEASAQRVPPVTAEGLDYVGRTLRDKIDTAQRAGNRDDARVYSGLRDQLLNAVDNHPDEGVRGAWQAARDAYKGPSREIDALQAGREALADGVTPEQMRRDFAALGTDGERQQYRNGLFNAMRDKLGKASDTANFVRTVSGNQALRDKFATVAHSPAALDAFNATMGQAQQRFTEATRPTPEAWHQALAALDARAAKGEPGIAAARDALAAHMAQNPDYARARGIQAEYGGLQDAIGYGRQSLAGGADPIWPSTYAARIGDMSPAAVAANRVGQRATMEEAVGLAPNDQLAIKRLLGVGNTPGFTAPNVAPGAPDLSSFNAEKLATSFGHEPVARMQELLNANDAFNDTFNGVVRNSATARRQAMVEALKDADWKPRDVMDARSDHATGIGLLKQGVAKAVNAVGHALQGAPSNAVRDLDLARLGTLTGPERGEALSGLLDRLPAYQGRESAVQAKQREAMIAAALLAGGGRQALMDRPSPSPSTLAKALRQGVQR